MKQCQHVKLLTPAYKQKFIGYGKEIFAAHNNQSIVPPALWWHTQLEHLERWVPRDGNATVTPLDTWLKIAVDGDPDGMLTCDHGYDYEPRSAFPIEVARIEKVLAAMAADGKYLRDSSSDFGSGVDPFPVSYVSAEERTRAETTQQSVSTSTGEEL